MITGKSTNRSGILPILTKVFSKAVTYVSNKIDTWSRKSAAKCLVLGPDANWGDIHQYASGRGDMASLRKRNPRP